MKRKEWLGALAVAAIILIAVGFQGPVSPRPRMAQAAAPVVSGETMRTLTVTGTGETTLSPDIAQVALAVETQHKDLEQALAENNQRTARVIQALRQHGIPENDIRTANVSVQEEKRYDNEGHLASRSYVVTNSLNVTVRDLGQLGKILNDALSAGANRMDSLIFTSSRLAEAQLQAKLAAVADARHQAEAIAQSAGVMLDTVQTITFGPLPVVRDQTYKAEAMSAPVEQVPVSPGEMRVTATVTIVFRIR